MLREILHYPDPRLKQTAAAVKNINGDLVQLVDDMVLTMYAAPGIGLAAVQIGVPQRTIVLDLNPEEPGKQLLKLVNPIITARERDTLWEEGCLSVIDYTAAVRRAPTLEVKPCAPAENELTLQAEGVRPVAQQHELA